MSYVLDQTVSDPAGYVELRCPNTVKVLLQVSNGAVLVGFGEGQPSPVYGPDEPLLPVVGVLVRRCDAIRVRARAPVPTPAPKVTLTAITAAES